MPAGTATPRTQLRHRGEDAADQDQVTADAAAQHVIRLKRALDELASIGAGRAKGKTVVTLDH